MVVKVGYLDVKSNKGMDTIKMQLPEVDVKVRLNTAEIEAISASFPKQASEPLLSAVGKLRGAFLKALILRSGSPRCVECGSSENELLSTQICVECF